MFRQRRRTWSTLAAHPQPLGDPVNSTLVTAASAHATGGLAIVIILVVLALILIGACVVVRFVVRKGKQAL